MKQMGDKKLAMTHLTTAETIKKMHQAYKDSGQLDSKALPKKPTPEIVLGMDDATR